MALRAPTQRVTASRIRARPAAAASSSQVPRRTTSTSSPLFTDPRSVVPSSASSRSKSGTPSLRNRAAPAERHGRLDRPARAPGRQRGARRGAADAQTHVPAGRAPRIAAASPPRPPGSGWHSRRAPRRPRAGARACEPDRARPRARASSSEKPPNAVSSALRSGVSIARSRASAALAAPHAAKPATSATIAARVHPTRYAIPAAAADTPIAISSRRGAHGHASPTSAPASSDDAGSSPITGTLRRLQAVRRRRCHGYACVGCSEVAGSATCGRAKDADPAGRV